MIRAQSTVHHPIVDAVREFVTREVEPAAAALEHADAYPHAMVARMKELGLFGALIPREHGGLGLDVSTYARVIEEICRGFMSLAGVMPWMTRGERRVCLASGETVGARRLEDGWVLSGRASFVESGERADFFLVSARGDDGVLGSFLIERDAHRLAVSAPHDTLGGRGLEPCDLLFDGVQVDGSARLADGASEAAEALWRLRNAAVGVGLAQAAFEAVLRYSQQRSAFGQPICQHQAVLLKLADMATRITASRLLTYRAAERLDADASDTIGAFMARIDSAETAASVTLEAMRIHGGYGYTREFPVERFYRDAAWLLTSPRDLDAERRELARRWRQAVNG